MRNDNQSREFRSVPPNNVKENSTIRVRRCQRTLWERSSTGRCACCVKAPKGAISVFGIGCMSWLAEPVDRRGIPISSTFFIGRARLAFETRALRTLVARRRSASLFARFWAADNSVRLARCPSLSAAALPGAMVKPDGAAWPRNSRRLYLPNSRARLRRSRRCLITFNSSASSSFFMTGWRV